MASFSYICIVLLSLELHINIGKSKTNDNSLTLQNDMINTINTTLPSSRCGDQCIPGNTSRNEQCNYIQDCCGDTLGDGSYLNYLEMQYCFLIQFNHWV